MFGGAIARRLNKTPNRIELTPEELRTIDKTAEGDEKFVDRVENGKIIRYYGVIRKIERGSMVRTPKDTQKIIINAKTFFDVRKKEDTGFVEEPKKKPSKNHTWSA